MNDSTTFKTEAGCWVLIHKPSDPKHSDSENKPSHNPTSERVTRHPKFFFDNVLVTIQVENTLFNVHKYQLAKSEVFSDMFKMPNVKGNDVEGSSPERPIVMKGIAASDFAALLTVLYASRFSDDEPDPDTSLIIPAFRMATMFNFSGLHAHLLSLADSNLCDVDRVVFAREFDIKEWLAPAHIRLCQREKPLGTEEARKLGVDSVLIISHMREQHRNRSSTSSFTVNDFYCSSCSGMDYYSANYYNCDRCGGAPGSAHLRYNGRDAAAQSSATTAGDISIEAGVKKWVEDGCMIKDT